MTFIQRLKGLFALAHAALAAWAAPAAGSPANGWNLSDVVKSGVLPIVIFVLAHIGLFIPDDATALMVASFVLDLLRRHGPPGIPAVVDLTVAQAAPQEALPPAP